MSAQENLTKKFHFGKIALVFAFFILLALFMSTDIFLLDPAAKDTLDFRQHFIMNLNIWFPWAILAFLVILLGKKFPLNARTWRYFLPAHLAASISLTFVHTVMVYCMFMLNERLLILEAELSIEALFTKVFHLDVLTYGIILGAGHLFNYSRKIRRLEQRIPPLEARLNQMRIESLRRQPHSHFILNILDVISMILPHDPRAADRMINRLYDLLRLDFENALKLEVTLKQELGFTKRYLEIMEVRFREKFKVEFHIPEDVEEALVPNFILPPLVENAVIHGIAPQNSGGEIEIGAYRKYRKLVIQISDSGIGLNQAQEVLIRKGTSLSSIHDRLKLLYGEDFKFQLENLETKGAAAILEIPFHRNPLKQTQNHT